MSTITINVDNTSYNDIDTVKTGGKTASLTTTTYWKDIEGEISESVALSAALTETVNNAVALANQITDTTENAIADDDAFEFYDNSVTDENDSKLRKTTWSNIKSVLSSALPHNTKTSELENDSGFLISNNLKTINGISLVKTSDAENIVISGGSGSGSGISITSTSVTYQVSDSGTTTPTGDWLSTIPSSEPGKYLWTRTIVTYSDGTSTTAYSVAYQGTNGGTGATGATGADLSITSITIDYVATTTADLPDDNANWSSDVPLLVGGQYLWTRTTIIYSNNDTAVSYSVAYQGKDGENGTGTGAQGEAGADGIGIVSIIPLYWCNNEEGVPTAPSGITPVEEDDSTLRVTWMTVLPAYDREYCYVYTCNLIEWDTDEADEKYSWTDPVFDRTLSTIAGWCYTSNSTYIDGALIFTGTITASQIASNTITANQIAAGTITGDLIASHSITGDLIVAGSITADLIDTTGLTVTGKSAYEIAVDNGFEGTEAEWIESLKGATGAAGATGVGVESTTILYSTSDSGTTPPSGSWNSSIPTVKPNYFLWMQITIEYTDGTSKTSYLKSYQGADGADGNDGTNGTNGIGITSIVPLYYCSSSSTAPSAPTSKITSTSTSVNGWRTVLPAYTRTYCYVYICNQILWSDSDTHYTWTTPALDQTLSAMAGWCYTNDRTLIEGAKIYTGSLAANSINGDCITANSLTADKISSDEFILSNDIGTISMGTGSTNGGAATTGIRIEGPSGLLPVYDETTKYALNTLYVYASDAGIKLATSLRQEDGADWALALELDWTSKDDENNDIYPANILGEIGVFPANTTDTSGVKCALAKSSAHIWANTIALGKSQSACSLINLLASTINLNSAYVTTLSGAIATSSDQRVKNSISSDMSKYENFFYSLKPSYFKYNDGSSDRYHTGFIAQEVEEALVENGLTTQDFAGYVLLQNSSENTDENAITDQLALRYEEFISLNTYMIQKLTRRVEELEAKIEELTSNS